VTRTDARCTQLGLCGLAYAPERPHGAQGATRTVQDVSDTRQPQGTFTPSITSLWTRRTTRWSHCGAEMRALQGV